MTTPAADLDADLDALSCEALLAEAKRMRAAIRAHRASSGHDLCWYHPDLWALLPESASETPSVPEWPQFMRGCIAYRHSLDVQLPAAHRTDLPFGE